MADSKDAKGVMVALLPDTDDWCLIKLPHLTVVYAGMIDDASDDLHDDLDFQTRKIVASFYAPTLRVVGSSVFGGSNDNPEVDVLNLVTSPDLKVMRKMLVEFNKSSYSEFNPHVTVGPAGSISKVEIPDTIRFGKIALVYGTKKLIYDF